MKKFLCVLLVIVLIIVLFSYFKFERKTEGNISLNKTEDIVTNKVEEQNQEQEAIIKDTDEIEVYNNVKARCKVNLNFRDFPSSEGKIILTIPNNTVFNVLAKIRNGWYKISLNDSIGYVSGDYITILSEEEIKEITVNQEFENTFAKVHIASELNIRESANKNAKRLTSVKSGSILKVMKKMANDWYYVEGNKIEGYVSGEYITILTQEEYNTYSSDTNNLLNPAENIIATYTSTSTYNNNSRYNMHLAADYENGVIVNPGETYSHLNTIHPANEPNKYVASTIFTGNGQTAQASGGGICQTSSTTYAAIVSAQEKGVNTGFNITAQAPHSGRVNYVPRKYEATVASGSQDFCFRNCNSYAVKIVTSYSGNTLTVTIYKI